MYPPPHITVGGQNVLNSTLNKPYENVLQQVNLAEQLTSSEQSNKAKLNPKP